MWRWFNFETNQITLTSTGAFTPKDSDHRTIPMFSALRRILELYRKAADGEYVLRSVRKSGEKTPYRVDHKNAFRGSALRRECRGLHRIHRHVFNSVHNIQAGVPPENILALYDGAYEFGHYT